MPLCGGTSEVKSPDAESKAISLQIKSAIEAKSGIEYSTYELMSFKTQVVAGLNYFLKLKIGDSEALHARVYMDLQGELTLSDIQTNKTLEDDIKYF